MAMKTFFSGIPALIVSLEFAMYKDAKNKDLCEPEVKIKKKKNPKYKYIIIGISVLVLIWFIHAIILGLQIYFDQF